MLHVDWQSSRDSHQKMYSVACAQQISATEGYKAARCTNMPF